MVKKEIEERSGHKLTLDLFESNFKDVLSRNPMLETRINTFMKNVALRYRPPQANLIRRAVVVGVVAHQNNEIEKKRFRKTGNEGENPTPYFIHPLEMAECMLNFDWITIAATLLHDVPEDVKLNGIEGKKAWLSTIEEIFEDSGYQYMLTSIIDGVTERKLPPKKTNDEIDALYERLEKSPIYKMITSYIQKGGFRHGKKTLNNIDEEVRKSIAEVVYNLEHLFLSATQTPEELRIFFIKIADVWHNLQSPEWVKDIKVLRGRIAAGLADLLGWYFMRDKIIIALAKITDVTTPFSPHAEKKDKILFSEELEFFATQEMSADINIVKAIIPQIFNESSTQSTTVSEGYPLPHSDKKIPTLKIYGEKITLPQPEIRVTMPAEQINNLRKKFENFRSFRISINDPQNKKGTSTILIELKESLTERLANLLGRNRIDFIISPGNRNSFMLRIEDDKLHIIDMFSQQNNKIVPAQIPEFGLLHRSFFTESESLLSTHIQALIGFCYEPNLIGQVGEGIVPVFHQASGRLFFLPKALSVQEASEICVIPELVSLYSGQTLWDLYDSNYKPSQALQRIIEV